MSKKFGEILPNVREIPALRFLILDVDGVMTDGSIGYVSNGDELKSFDSKDGVGMKYWMRAGHHIGIISGRTSPAVTKRGEELGVQFIAQKVADKLSVAEKMLAEAGVSFSETAVIGDDLPDIPLIRRAALGVAVADAAPEVKDAARCITINPGGRGAVRETVEAILKAQDRWRDILARY